MAARTPWSPNYRHSKNERVPKLNIIYLFLKLGDGIVHELILQDKNFPFLK